MTSFEVERLTAEGAEFLQSVRDDKVFRPASSTPLRSVPCSRFPAKTVVPLPSPPLARPREAERGSAVFHQDNPIEGKDL